MAGEVGSQEMKDYLKSAGMYEENMSSNMLKQYYSVIKESETTASKENQSRIMQEEDEKLVKELEDTINGNLDGNISPMLSQQDNVSLIEDPEEQTHISNQESDFEEESFTLNLDESEKTSATESNIKDARSLSITFNDMCLNVKGKILPSLSHKLRYISLQNSEKYIKAPFKVKVQMMSEYFSALAKYISNKAKRSEKVALLPLPISASMSDSNMFDDGSDFEEMYTLRSGRQTKRKVYSFEEDDSSQDEFAVKRQKNNDEDLWLSKATARNAMKNVTKKQNTSVTDVLESNNKNALDEKSDDENTSTVGKAPQKRVLGRKLTNDEIIQRSKLFADGTKTKKNRASELVARAISEKEKMEKEEKQQEEFVNRLEITKEAEEKLLEEDTDDGFEIEESPIRRRVVPPSLDRRKFRKKKDELKPLQVTSSSLKKPLQNSNQQTEPLKGQLSVDAKPVLPNSFHISPRRSLATARTVAVQANGESSVTSNNGENQNQNLIKCPLCSKSFPSDEIQAHASSCCDEDAVRGTRSKTKLSRLMCPVCDKVVPYDIDYDVHVKQCGSEHT